MQGQKKTETQVAEELKLLRQQVGKLRAINRFQQAQLEAPGYIVIATDLQGKLTFYTNRAEQLYGWSQEEAMALHLADVIEPGQARELAKLTQKTGWQGQLLARRKDGTSFACLLKSAPVIDAEGEVIGTIILCKESASEGEIPVWLNESIEEKDRLLAAYHIIGQAILSSLTLEQVLDKLPQQILAAGIFRSLLVALVDEENHRVQVLRGFSSYVDGVFVPGSSNFKDNPNITGISYDLDDVNIIAEVARTGTMQVVDGWDAKRFDPDLKPNAGDKVKISYFFPIKQGARVLAVLATSSTPEMKEDMLHRIEMMQPLLDQVAIAIEHARLYEEVQQTITERTQAEDALRARETFLDNVLASSLNGVYIYDLEQQANIYMNRQYRRLTGWSIEDLNAMDGEEFMNLFHPEDRSAVLAHMDDVFRAADGAGLEIEYRFKTKDGRWLWLLSLDTVFERNEQGGVKQFIGTFLDITDRKEMEEEIRRNQNLESLGLLAGGIAHDFNNVLTGITGNLSILDYTLDEDSAEHEMVATALRAAEQASGLAKQLLTFAKGGTPVTEVTAIEGLLRETTELSLRGSKTKPIYRFAEGLCPVNIDKGQIAQVLQNLVLNADQAMPEGGILTIAAENVEISDRDHLPLAEGHYVKVSVIDQGIGMSDLVMAKIFDPYYTTKPAGHGLGLSITYSIIQKHGGHINVRSNIDLGTTFDFYLPTVARSPTVATVARPVLEQGTGRILLMDDEELIHASVGKILEALGYEVDCVCDGQAALSAYQAAMEAGRAYALVIMDLTIPGAMGGKETIGALRELDPQALALVSSGYAHDPIMANYKGYGFAGSLAKPVSMKDLAAMVKEVLQK
jgi:PAS domain S-box-containing protein